MKKTLVKIMKIYYRGNNGYVATMEDEDDIGPPREVCRHPSDARQCCLDAAKALKEMASHFELLSGIERPEMAPPCGVDFHE